MLEQQKGKLFAAHEYRVDVIDELTRDRDSCRPYYYCNGYREHKKTRMLLMLRRRTRTRAGPTWRGRECYYLGCGGMMRWWPGTGDCQARAGVALLRQDVLQ